jgi:FkbM family methyltransferase
MSDEGEEEALDPAIRRSVAIYYGDPAHGAAMDRLYGRFLRPGDLAFDIGSHVGDRIASFRRLGARVVACEPQPALAAYLSRRYGADGAVMVEETAVGATAGRIDLLVNEANPTVTTASRAFVDAAAGAPGWEGQRWSGQVEAAVTTLDTLIARHGRPAFVKIDVEGFEADVLAGLSFAPPALSFEFTTIQRDVAHRCLDRLTALGFRRFDASLGESHRLVFGEAVDAAAIARWLDALPALANSGDIYAIAADDARATGVTG